LSTEVKTGFEKFMQQYNESYVMRCKELGLQNEYQLDVNGKTITYIRKRLTTRQYTDLEKARAETDKKNAASKDAMENAERMAELYLFTGQAYLTNKETQKPIQKEEFENMIWEDIKMVLDACHLRSMLGVPNSERASTT
jgi:ABC-type siderophore export system fused ATPase/permease subunit